MRTKIQSTLSSVPDIFVLFLTRFSKARVESKEQLIADLVSDAGYEEERGGEEEDHEGRGGLALSHACTQGRVVSLFAITNPLLL